MERSSAPTRSMGVLGGFAHCEEVLASGAVFFQPFAREFAGLNLAQKIFGGELGGGKDRILRLEGTLGEPIRGAIFSTGMDSAMVAGCCP
jgi:hypothetical protein